jgi:hypothetical protein
MKLYLSSRTRHLATEGIVRCTIVNSTEDAVVSVDVSGPATSWNTGAGRTYGVDTTGATAATFHDVLPRAPPIS